MRFLVVVGVLIGLVSSVPAPLHAQAPAVRKAVRNPPKPQTRPVNDRVKVDPTSIQVDDGDSIVIRWPDGDEETVRILGIDTPETRHVEHNIPVDQPFGQEARAFAQGAFATATEVELLRFKSLDPYGRTLGYLFVNGKNYSILVVKARLAAESVSTYGDNGFPEIAAEVVSAAKAAGPLPFENPGVYRGRMRTLSEWMKSKGATPLK
jgi:micrococcal nuclease